MPVKDAFKHTEDGPTGTTGTTACTNGHLGAGDPEATETDSSGKPTSMLYIQLIPHPK